MPIRYPRPLRPGDTVGVTAPSAGVAGKHRARLEVALDVVRRAGYAERVGPTTFDDGVTAGPAVTRAAELTALVTDPAVRAVVPPWGGELAVDLLGRLDWDALAADPTWLVGFSDLSTLLLPLTTRTGVATLHGNNLMDTPYTTPDGLLGWLDVVTAPPGATLVQESPRRHRASGWDDYVATPDVATWALDTPGTWVRLDSSAAPDEPVDVTGRVIGGCVETVALLAGTPFGDVPAFAAGHAPEGLVVYLDVAEWRATDVARAMWAMRHAGWFDAANAVLVSRTHAPSAGGLSQRDAARDALGDLGIPVLADVECGHVPPFLTLVNGALARVEHDARVSRITQTLVR